jgi:hypothetical protein
MSNLYKAPTAQIQRKTALTSLTGGLGKLIFRISCLYNFFLSLSNYLHFKIGPTFVHAQK